MVRVPVQWGLFFNVYPQSLFICYTSDAQSNPESVHEEGRELAHCHMGTAHQQASFVQDRQHNQVSREPSLQEEENKDVSATKGLSGQEYKLGLLFNIQNFSEKSFEIFAAVKEILASPRGLRHDSPQTIHQSTQLRRKESST